MNLENRLPRSLCSYEVSKADNGYIFGYYDITSDAYKIIIAETPEGLGKIIIDWQTERVTEMVKYMTDQEAVS